MIGFRKIPLDRLAGLACGLGAAAGMVGCATQTESPGLTAAQRTSGLYATQFLAPDGTVYSRQSSLAKAKEAESKAFWNGDDVSGASSIVISLSAQTASFYKGGKLVGVSPISSGSPSFPTPAGSFRIIQKDRDHRSNLYGDYVDAAGNVLVSNVDVQRDKKPPGAIFRGAPMDNFMRIHNGVGMHSGFLPGFADSHGCIRLPDRMATLFFANTSVGTPVRVVR